MKKLFGTDGVRGLSNCYPMTPEKVLKLGMAAAVHLGNSTSDRKQTNRVIIGKDTRISCYMFEAALMSGLASMGKNVMLLGPMPTPAISMLTRTMRADLGIMISASHNPYYDNGIKLFDSSGAKMSDEDEAAIEALLDQDLESYLVTSDKVGKVERLKESIGRYISFVKAIFPHSFTLSGLKVALDCANGAAYKIAPIVLYELGAEIHVIGDTPNGFNINQDCGSTHISSLRAKVIEQGCDVGIAYDGDGDRLIMIDEKGAEIDGDHILGALAVFLKEKKFSDKNEVVGTIMSNMALDKYLDSNGIKLHKTAVGDRYVSEKMNQNNLDLGAEPSGHVIIKKVNKAGDGLVASLFMLWKLVESNQPASVALKPFEKNPSVIKNYRYVSNPMESKMFMEDIENIKKANADYKIIVRKSGTEPLIRVLVEGPDSEVLSNISSEIQDLIVKY